MRVGSGEPTYDWIDNWAVIPDSPEGRINGRTHGVVVTSDGSVVVFYVGNPAVLVYDQTGSLIQFVGAPHSVASDAEGNLYLVEWVTGGRITKLARVQSTSVV